MARKDSDTVNLRELAEIMGVSDNTLRELVRANDDFPVLSRGSHGVPYEFSVSAVSDWWQGHQAQIKAEQDRRREELNQFRLKLFGGQLADETRGDLTAAEIGKEIEAELNALKLAKARGEYVVKADVERVVAAAFTELRKELMQLGTEITRSLGLDTAARATVDDMVKMKLERCSDRLVRQENYAQAA